MRRTLIGLATVGTIAALTAGGAGAAAPKISCKMIADAAGDAAVETLPAPANDNDDVLSADIASNAKTITAVIRLKSLTDRDPQWLPGRAYSVTFSIKGSRYEEIFLAARTFPQGVQYHLGHREVMPPLNSSSNIYDYAGTGSVNAAKGEIRISAPISELAKLAKLAKGTVIKGASATAERLAGQGVVGSQTVDGNRIPLGGFRYQSDISETAKPYTLGAPSCVKP